MKKLLEFGVVVAIGALSTVATATVIHDQNAGRTTSLDRQVQAGVKDVTQWIQRRLQSTSSPAMSVALGSDSSFSSKNVPNIDANSNGSSTGYSGWTSADVLRMVGILKSFAATMTPSDWIQTMSVIKNNPPEVASADLSNLLHHRISAADLTWLTNQFAANGGFTIEDVQLLQEALVQIQETLTPDEQQLLSQRIGTMQSLSP